MSATTAKTACPRRVALSASRHFSAGGELVRCGMPPLLAEPVLAAVDRAQASAITRKQLAMREALLAGNRVAPVAPYGEQGLHHDSENHVHDPQDHGRDDQGAPVSATYLSLWCNTWDNSYVVLNKPADPAYASGFSGQRGEHTWATRVKKLRELRFIDIKPGKSGPMSNVIIWNPHLVLRWHHQEKTGGLMDASYNALLEWAHDIGAKDMTDPMDPIPEPGIIAPPAAPRPRVGKTTRP